jgi:hypothetical protein
MQSGGRIRHYKAKTAEFLRTRPDLLFEVRFDFHDVRSGLSGSDSGAFSAPVLTESDLDWTADMVHPIDLKALEEIQPVRPVEWPPSADSQITRYFLKNRRIGLWKNSELGIYSQMGESRDEFVDRCIELVSEERRSVLIQVRDIFIHRFLEAEQRALDSLQDEPWSARERDRRSADLRNAFSEIRESFSRCFLHENLEPLTKKDLFWTGRLDIETQERLETLRDECLSMFNRLTGQVLKRAHAVEIYEVSLNHDEIDVASRGFLW